MIFMTLHRSQRLPWRLSARVRIAALHGVGPVVGSMQVCDLCGPPLVRDGTSRNQRGGQKSSAECQSSFARVQHVLIVWNAV